MRATINGIDVMGTPEEIDQFIELRDKKEAQAIMCNVHVDTGGITKEVLSNMKKEWERASRGQ